MELIKNDYLRGTGHGDTWHVSITPPTNKIQTYFQETIKNVEYLHANKTGRFQVLFSGGLDSQYVCEVLLRLGMLFDVIIIELKSNSGEVYNYHDIKYAYEFCKSRGITPIKYALNFDSFVDSGKIIEIAESVTCSSFALPATMHVASQLDGFSLLGNDPPYLRLVNQVWMLEELEYIHSLLRFYKRFNVNGCPFLLSYTPEMMLSFLLDPSIKELGMGLLPGKTGSNSTKARVFNNGSNFSMETYDFTDVKDYTTTSRVKYTGYEKIRMNDQLMNHPNMQKFEYYKTIWAGVYFEPYKDAITRLGIHQ